MKLLERDAVRTCGLAGSRDDAKREGHGPCYPRHFQTVPQVCDGDNAFREIRPTRTLPRRSRWILPIFLSFPCCSVALAYYTARNGETIIGRTDDVTAPNTTSALPSMFLRGCYTLSWPTATRKSEVSLVTQSDEYALLRAFSSLDGAGRTAR